MIHEWFDAFKFGFLYAGELVAFLIGIGLAFFIPLMIGCFVFAILSEAAGDTD